MMDEIVETWEGLPPVFHISEQAPDKMVGAHSDFIEVIPQHLLDVPERYNTSINIEVEAKAKEAAILKLMKKYKEIF
jgi:UV DNA damage repair endonuclease